MNKIRVGIIGYGVVGKRRRLSISKCKNFKLVAISDVDKKRDPKISNIKFFNSYNHLITSGRRFFTEYM